MIDCHVQNFHHSLSTLHFCIKWFIQLESKANV